MDTKPTQKEKTVTELAEKTKKLEAVRDQLGQGWLQMERDNSRLIAALNSLPLAFIFTDDHNNITRTSAAVNTLLGPPPQDKWTIEEIQIKLSDFDLAANLQKCLQERRSLGPSDVKFQSKILRIFIAPIDILKESLAVMGTVIVLEDVSPKSP